MTSTATTSRRSVFTLASFLALCLAARLRGGTFGWDVFALLITSFILFLLSFRDSDRPLPSLRFDRLCIAGIIVMAILGPICAPHRDWVIRIATAIVALIVIPIVVRMPQRLPQLLPRLMILFLLVYILVPVELPNPYFDVWIVIQNATRALVHFQNPYTVPHPVIIDEHYFAHGYNYPPLLLPFYAISYALFGDIRYTTIAALAVIMLVMRKMLSRQTNPYRASLLVLLFLINPLHLVVIRWCWTEGQIQGLVAWVVYILATAPARTTSYIGTALLLSAKQYLPLSWPFFLKQLPSPRKWGIAIGIALIPVLLFAAWGPLPFYREVIDFFFHFPARDDSLSLYTIFYRYGHFQLPVYLTLAPFVGIVVWYWRQKSPTLQHMLRATTLAYFCLFLLGCSFANYYYFLETLMWWTLFLEFAPTSSTR